MNGFFQFLIKIEEFCFKIIFFLSVMDYLKIILENIIFIKIVILLTKTTSLINVK